MIGYWQDQAGSIYASFFQFTIQTHFAIATFRRHPRDLPALVLLETALSSSSYHLLTWTRSLP